MLKSLSRLVNSSKTSTSKKMDVAVPKSISHYNWFARYNNGDNYANDVGFSANQSRS